MAAMNIIALDTELVTLTTNGAVATLTLNRPDARNALSLEMIAAMEEALGKIESGLDAIRVMVLAGAYGRGEGYRLTRPRMLGWRGQVSAVRGGFAACASVLQDPAYAHVGGLDVVRLHHLLELGKEGRRRRLPLHEPAVRRREKA